MGQPEKLERCLIAFVGSLFVFLGYLLGVMAEHQEALQKSGYAAYGPFMTVVLVTGLSCYYHAREAFSDHFRLILSSMGFPGLLAGLQAINGAS